MHHVQVEHPHPKHPAPGIIIFLAVPRANISEQSVPENQKKICFVRSEISPAGKVHQLDGSAPFTGLHWIGHPHGIHVSIAISTQ